MANLLCRILLFLSSYFPLALILFVIYFGRNTRLAVGILIVATLGLVGMVVYFRTAQTMGAVTVTIGEIQRKDAEAMAYIVGYLIPFLSIPFEQPEYGIALLIFLIVLGILYVNSNLIHINPMLNLAGCHIYEISLKDGGNHALITKRRITRGETLSAIKLGEDILLEKKNA